MTDRDHETPKAVGDGDGNPVSFTASEHAQLCEAVGTAVSGALGGLPVAVGFDVEQASFLVEVTGQVPEGAKN